MNRVSRRQLLKYGIAGAAGAVAAPYFIPSGVLAADGKPGANERITLGVIGVGRRARQLIAQVPDQGQIAAVADCYLTRCKVPYRYSCPDPSKDRSANWRIHQDYRELLDEKDIDAVIVATPDHGRVLVCIRACQAGKDIYGEKPLTVYVQEGRTLVQAVRKYQRVFQVGTQQRSMEVDRFASEFVRNGGLGKIRKIRAINWPGPNRIPQLPGEAIPKDLDWDMWLGQAEMRPFNNQLMLGWMGWRDYSGGNMTNMGAHGHDQIQCALGTDETGPVEFWPVTPGTNGAVSYRYANGVQVDLDLEEKHGPDCGAVFIGEKGKIEINRNKFKTNPKDLIKNGPSEAEAAKWRDEVSLWQAKYHIANWLDCIKTRKKPVADVEIGHRSITICHLCNIAREVGRKIKWDPEKEQIIGDDEASRLLSRPRRKGYELPQLA
jgi:predicted dehydrogenase